jgi:uncharacterized repeat protein (TIGR03837 family)
MREELKRVHVFCKVVDNYGDIGVCWRLSGQLAGVHAFDVTLWVDDLVSFKAICDEVDAHASVQTVHGITVRHWIKSGWDKVAPQDVGQIVIEGFGCTLPDAYIQAMAQAAVAPVWLNLEYLSAESWVEDCHAMVSVHPTLPLKKYFFFPGFSDRTGGLLIDQATLDRKALFDADPEAGPNYLASQGVPMVDGALYMSLFCYPHAPVVTLFNDLAAGARPMVCIVPDGVATASVEAFLGQVLPVGKSMSKGNLTVYCLPFSDQPSYDTLLWSCDMNFVRGEDSFVRAQWAAKPLVWQIYIQDEDAHVIKLDAFLERYMKAMPADMAERVRALWHRWNGVETLAKPVSYADMVQEDLLSWQPIAHDWFEYLLKNGDLATNIRRFAEKIS